jgi:hypothetical protein
MITIYWYCHETSEDEKFVTDSLNELARNLREEPIKLNIAIASLQNEPYLLKKVNAILNKFTTKSYTFEKCAEEIMGAFTYEKYIEKLLVYCRTDSKIAKAALNEKSSALWGLTRNFVLAAVYKPRNKFIIWHEALHLLGLDECYDENTLIRNCEWETCIMQYEPPPGVNENWPSLLCDNLCDKNIKQLQKLAEKVE